MAFYTELMVLYLNNYIKNTYNLWILISFKKLIATDKREKIACRVSTELLQWDNLAFNILEIIASYRSLLV